MVAGVSYSIATCSDSAILRPWTRSVSDSAMSIPREGVGERRSRHPRRAESERRVSRQPALPERIWGLPEAVGALREGSGPRLKLQTVQCTPRNSSHANSG